MENSVQTQPSQESPDQETAVANAERLDRIERHLTNLRQEMQENTKRILNKNEERTRKNSRATVTGAFAFLGMKIGLLIAKGIFLHDSSKELKKSEVYDDFIKYHEENQTPLLEKTWAGINLLLKNTYQENNIWVKFGLKAAVAGAIGAAIGAAIGWARGNRIKDPHDLIKHPIESLKKIFGPKPPPEPGIPVDEAVNTEVAVIPPPPSTETPTLASNQWRGKFGQEQAPSQPFLSFS